MNTGEMLSVLYYQILLHAGYNEMASLDLITNKTACVIAETVQAESGVIAPAKEWLTGLRKKCY